MKALSNFIAPIITLSVAVVFCVVYWAAPLSATNNDLFWVLVLSEPLAGEALFTEPWRWLTAHFVHTNLNHLIWNCGAWLLLAWVIESRNRAQLVFASVAGAAGVCLWFFYFNNQFNYYAGASGMLNALFVVALNLSRQFLSNALVAVIGLGAVAKIGYEISVQTSLVGDAAWPPTPAAHLAGFIAGLLVVIAAEIVKQVADSTAGKP